MKEVNTRTWRSDKGMDLLEIANGVCIVRVYEADRETLLELSEACAAAAIAMEPGEKIAVPPASHVEV